ncbi:uncharacterized protein LOC130443621 isoform X1 [Diorhabda sublineata]|uniref:uncharacterized protein LOC130443621 isoform X1 n=2 Tax=Diorhabda sublineata TaxID=1163346 RepID=UPI0024E09D5F|nr:uncharacterized protein LOC130443621 isoform X1 [Diorhabda sublineata]
MSLRKIVVFCFMIINFGKVALASKYGEGGGVNRLSNDLKPSLSPLNDSELAENLGPPDSHEAMNNREIYSIPVNIREKRSFEFLMGLINNNSKFEVTKVDPESTTEKPAVVTGDRVGASEILLELMVRIASHPDQWDRVHKILQTLDQDLKASRSVVTQLQTLPHHNKTIQNSTGDNQINSNKNISMYINNTVKTEKKMEDVRWPNDEKHSILRIVNNNNYSEMHETKALANNEKSKEKSNKPTYPKNFTYHRVTGKPDNTSKNPRAYIAVSVIAPNKTSSKTKAVGIEEDLTLENELHQLKPWTHLQNLKDMESIRSKWIVRRNKQNKES